MRGACKRAESECRFAHPKECVTTDDGLVTVCMDAVKGRCTRAPCRYFHPPLHLQAQIKAAQSRANNIAVMAHLLKTNKNIPKSPPFLNFLSSTLFLIYNSLINLSLSYPLNHSFTL